MPIGGHSGALFALIGLGSCLLPFQGTVNWRNIPIALTTGSERYRPGYNRLRITQPDELEDGLVGSDLRPYCSFAYSALASFRMGDVGVGVFQRAKKWRAGCGKFYCGNPTLRTSSAKRGSGRSESRVKSVLSEISPSSDS